MQRIIISILGLLVCLTCKLEGQCSFSISDENACATEDIVLTVDAPDAGVEYSWDIDQDEVVDLYGPTPTFTLPQLSEDTTLSIVLYANSDSCFTRTINVGAVPDASIGVPPGIVILNGKEMKACNGSPEIELSIINTSKTFSTNRSYTINWGDGSPAETYDNTTFSNTNTISHTFQRLGYFSIFVTVESENGCVFTENYTFYNGGNPSVGLVNPGNTVGLCAPATLSFPITNTENNPPGTEYRVFIGGVVVDSFTQENVPPAFNYTFDENSCGARTTTGAYTNAFDVQIIASNPCNSSAATIEPIEVSSPPELDFGISSPPTLCPGQVLSFDNQTTNIFEIISGNPSDCIDVLNPSWTISGNAGEDWNVVNGNLFGSNNVDIEFLRPGVYTITMQVVSFACGPFELSKDITIFEPPQISLQDTILNIDELDDGGDCAPLKVVMPELAAVDSLSFNWSITPAQGWEFVDSTDERTERPHILFSEGGDYMIRVEVSNPCSSVFWDGTIAVPGVPDVGLVPIQDFCQSATLNFDDQSVIYYSNGSDIINTKWSFPGAGTIESSEAYPTDIVYDSAGTYIVSLSMENACGIKTVSDTFVVQQPGSLTLPPDQTICASSEPVLLEAMPPGGSWSGPGVRGNYFYPAEAFIGQNTVTYSYGTGVCFIQGSFNMNVLRAPEANAGDDIIVCQNEPVVSLNGSPSGGIWLSMDSLDLSGSEIDPRLLDAGTYPLVYEVADGQGCVGRDTMELRVKAAPQLTVSDTSYCNTPGRVRLPVATPGGGIWSGRGVVDPEGYFDPLRAGGPGTYRLTYTYQANNGCEVSTRIRVGVIDPSQVDAGPDFSICATDDTISLRDFGSPAGGRWVSQSPGLSNGVFDPALADAGDNVLLYRIGSGNCRVTDTLTINVIRLNNAQAGPNENVCEGSGILILSGGSPLGGRWSGPGITDPSKGHFDPAAVGVGTYTIQYAIQDQSTGCANIDTKKVNVRPTPTVDFVIPELVCKGTNVTVENNSDAAENILWELSDGRSFDESAPRIRFNAVGTFQLDLSLETQYGCSADLQKEIEVTAPPTALFSLPEKEACEQLSVLPVNESRGLNNTYSWDFGNGQTSDQEVVSQPIMYAAGINDTLYFVRLEVSNQCGRDSYQDSVNIKALPTVDFGFNIDTACAPIIVSFNNISQGGADSFQWDFGNGSSSIDSMPPPQAFYADTIPVEYTITLTGQNQCGTDTMQRQFLAEPQTVTSFFNTSRLEGCAPMTIEFEDFSTPGTRISWDFGNGATSNLKNPVQTFAQPGQYFVKQYASNPCAMDSSEIVINVLSTPVVDFEYSDNLCVGQPIEFTNKSSDLSNPVWIFSTGDTINATDPSYTFNTVGTYDVILRITDVQTGCTTDLSRPISIGDPPAPIFSLDVTEGCAPLQVKLSNNSTGGDFYEWDFGDGNYSVASEPVHTYMDPGDYEVKLSVSDQLGCSVDTVLGGVEVYPVPEARFVVPDSIYCGLPATIAFINESEGAAGYEWSMGDGASSTLRSPAHEYLTPGEYDIKLDAVNQYGCADRYEKSIKLISQPIADFTLDTLAACSPFTATFKNYGRGTSYHWDFGDGLTSDERVPTHTFSDPGFYDISLVVGNDEVCFDTLNLPGLVEVWKTPTASFSWKDEIIGDPTGRVIFLNESEGAETYLWDFGDGNSSDEENPVHRYRSNELWEVFLEATGNHNCKDDTLLLIQPKYFGKLFVPSAFAPDDGRGESQLFLPKGHGIKEYHLQIFSAYGELLWESYELADGQPAEGWDGTHKGKPLPQDVYVWKVRAIFESGLEWTGNKEISGKYQKMGSVTLIR